MSTKPFEITLTSVYGQHVGLNADWSVQAWRVSHPGWYAFASGQSTNASDSVGYYLVDEEDGTLALVLRDFSRDDDGQTETIRTFDCTQVGEAIAFARETVAQKG